MILIFFRAFYQFLRFFMILFILFLNFLRILLTFENFTQFSKEYFELLGAFSLFFRIIMQFFIEIIQLLFMF